MVIYETSSSRKLKKLFPKYFIKNSSNDKIHINSTKKSKNESKLAQDWMQDHLRTHHSEELPDGPNTTLSHRKFYICFS